MFLGQQQLLTENPNSEALCLWYNISIPVSGRYNIRGIEDAYIDGLKSGNLVSNKT